MSQNQERIRKMAQLARLKLSAEEIEVYSQQIGDVLEYIHLLDSVKEEVEPAYSSLDFDLSLRADEVRAYVDAKTVLQTSKNPVYDHFQVPQVVSSSPTSSDGEPS